MSAKCNGCYPWDGTHAVDCPVHLEAEVARLQAQLRDVDARRDDARQVALAAEQTLADVRAQLAEARETHEWHPETTDEFVQEFNHRAVVITKLRKRAEQAEADRDAARAERDNLKLTARAKIEEANTHIRVVETERDRARQQVEAWQSLYGQAMSALRDTFDHDECVEFDTEGVGDNADVEHVDKRCGACRDLDAAAARLRGKGE